MTIKDAKRNFIVDEATGLFLERSIPEVTIKDIARRSGLGEATVYRYFSGRSELIVACALKLQDRVGEKFLFFKENESGFERLCSFYRAFSDTFEKDPELYRFLGEFDAYCVNEKADLDEYADNMDLFKAAFLRAYREGVRDRSVRRVEDPELFYYSTTHAVLSLCKKLAIEGDILRQDALTDKAAEVKTLVGVILASLSAN